MKKSILSVFILLTICLTLGGSVGAAPVFAETAEPSVTTTTDDTSTDTVVTTPDTVVTTTDTVEAGSEWSGDIVEPAGTNISEPPVPAEAPAPSTEATTTNVVTTPVAQPAPISVAPATQPEPATAPEPATSSTESDNSDDADTATDTDTDADAAESTDDVSYIEVPKTSFSERNRKITLMALVSTALVFFSSIFIASVFSLFRLIHAEHQQKKHESAVEETIRRHITRAE